MQIKPALRLPDLYTCNHSFHCMYVSASYSKKKWTW